MPKKDTLLYSYLENAVVEVQPQNDVGVFHPKTWLIRFVPEGNDLPIVYRFLCLSRNLTFDRSWDTVLTLEGELATDRTRAFARNRALGDFYAALPSLTTRELPPKISEHIKMLTEEILKVSFEPPPMFDDIDEFMPIGINGYARGPKLKEHRRLLVLSPFLSDDALKPLTDYGQDNILISRLESLDSLSEETIDKVKERTQIYSMDDAAETPENTDNQDQEAQPPDSSENLSGLHAKLFISEEGWNARILTGSANATQPAFKGENVEFLTSLTASRSKMGIDAFLDSGDSKYCFRNMLRTYVRDSKPIETDEVRKQLESDLETSRKILSTLGLRLDVSQASQDKYPLTMSAPRKADGIPASVTGKCYPIALSENRANDLSPLRTGSSVVFNDVSLPGLTSFMAFLLDAENAGKKLSLSFVLNLPISGLPAERDKRILHDIIADKGRFLRYLLMLLAGEDAGNAFLCTFRSDGQSEGNSFSLDFPLLEELVKAYSRHPEKLDRIASLIADLKESGQDRDLLPEGFESIWQTFMLARKKEGVQ